MNEPRTPARPLRAVVDELVRSGVRDVVICPGSRSTPLALALRSESRLRCWVHLDERAGAFFALGAARASRRSTAILVTSGTAAAELAPALVEAHEGRVPLLALTADRPAELRDRGAPQAIDQDHLYGRFAKWYAELPIPGEGELAETHVRGIVRRAVATAASAPAGPVHLNLPYREPLVPSGDLGDLVIAGDTPDTGGTDGGVAGTLGGRRVLDDEALADLGRRIAGARRGVIVCGPMDVPGFAAAVAGLAAVTDYPILADALANVRFGPHDRSRVMARADALLRVAAFAEAHEPDLILRFGGTPTSKALLGWLAATRAAQVVVDDGGWNEPTGRLVTMVQAEPSQLALDLAGHLERQGPASKPGGTDGWLASWQAAEGAAAEASGAWMAALGEPFEGQAFADLGTVLPDDALVLAGNSMPVRDMEAFLGTGPAAIRCLGNRGANGIDGLISTALGAAAATGQPIIAVVGDVSFLHDLNALVAATRLGLSAVIVLINNDGGGIFSFLPQAASVDPGVGLPQHFEELFGTPHGIDFGPLVQALGASYQRISTSQVAGAVRASHGQPGVLVLELRTDRVRNVELHRSVQAVVAGALTGAVTGAEAGAVAGQLGPEDQRQ